MQFCRKDVQFIFMQHTLKNRNMIEKRRRRTREYDEKRFDERSCYKDDAVFCSTNDSGKSAATGLQYCGYSDCWEIFRRRCIGSGWFCLFADDFFKRNHDWIVHGKRNHFFCMFRKAGQAAIEKLCCGFFFMDCSCNHSFKCCVFAWNRWNFTCSESSFCLIWNDAGLCLGHLFWNLFYFFIQLLCIFAACIGKFCGTALLFGSGSRWQYPIGYRICCDLGAGNPWCCMGNGSVTGRSWNWNRDLCMLQRAIIFSQKERTDLQLENTAASDAACFRSLCTAISNEFRNPYDTRACQQLWRIGDGSLCCCGKDRFVCLYASAGVQ